MIYTIYLNQNTHGSCVSITQTPKGEVLTEVPLDVLLPGEMLLGFMKPNGDFKYTSLDAKLISSTKVIKNSIRVLSPSSYHCSHAAFFYLKRFSRNLGGLYKDEFGYGSVDIWEANPSDSNHIFRRKTAPFLNEGLQDIFFELKVEIDHNSYVIYDHHRFPLPYVSMPDKSDAQ